MEECKKIKKKKKSTLKLELKLGWIDGISGERWENFKPKNRIIK